MRTLVLLFIVVAGASFAYLNIYQKNRDTTPITFDTPKGYEKPKSIVQATIEDKLKAIERFTLVQSEPAPTVPAPVVDSLSKASKKADRIRKHRPTKRVIARGKGRGRAAKARRGRSRR